VSGLEIVELTLCHTKVDSVRIKQENQHAKRQKRPFSVGWSNASATTGAILEYMG
jgi:hypothetical protein